MARPTDSSVSATLQPSPGHGKSSERRPSPGGGLGRTLSIGDIDGDGTQDIVVNCCDAPGAVYVISSDAGSLDRLDGLDGSLDGLIDISHVGRTDGWKIDGTGHGEIRRVAVAGDVDGDGLDDFVLNVESSWWTNPRPGVLNVGYRPGVFGPLSRRFAGFG